MSIICYLNKHVDWTASDATAATSPGRPFHKTSRSGEASQYASAAVADPDIRPIYVQMALGNGKNPGRPFDMAVSDYYRNGNGEKPANWDMSYYPWYFKKQNRCPFTDPTQTYAITGEGAQPPPVPILRNRLNLLLSAGEAGFPLPQVAEKKTPRLMDAAREPLLYYENRPNVDVGAIGFNFRKKMISAKSSRRRSKVRTKKRGANDGKPDHLSSMQENDHRQSSR